MTLGLAFKKGHADTKESHSKKESLPMGASEKCIQKISAEKRTCEMYLLASKEIISLLYTHFLKHIDKQLTSEGYFLYQFHAKIFYSLFIAL